MDDKKRKKINITNQSPDEIRAKTISLLSDIPDILVIFDDVRKEEELIDCLPSKNTNGKTDIIITTNNDNINLGNRLPLSALELSEAVKLLVSIIHPDDRRIHNDQERFQIETLVGDGILWRIPLAIWQAGRLIFNKRIPIKEYIKDFKRNLKTVWKDETGPQDHKHTLATTIALSIASINLEYPTAVNLLCICAHFSANNIPRRLLKRLVQKDIFVLNRAIELLKNYYLINTNETNNAISLHPLTQLVIKEYYSANFNLNNHIHALWNSAFKKNNHHISQIKLANLLVHFDSYVEEILLTNNIDKSAMHFIRLAAYLHKSLGANPSIGGDAHIRKCVEYFIHCQTWLERNTPHDTNEIAEAYLSTAEAQQGLLNITEAEIAQVRLLLNKGVAIAKQNNNNLLTADIITNIALENLLGIQRRLTKLNSIIDVGVLLKDLIFVVKESFTILENALEAYEKVLQQNQSRRYSYVITAYILTIGYDIISDIYSAILMGGNAAISSSISYWFGWQYGLLSGSTLATGSWLFGNRYKNYAQNFLLKALKYDSIGLFNDFNYSVLQRVWNSDENSFMTNLLESFVVRNITRYINIIRQNTNGYENAVGLYNMAKIFSYIPRQYQTAASIFREVRSYLLTTNKADDLKKVEGDLALLEQKISALQTRMVQPRPALQFTYNT